MVYCMRCKKKVEGKDFEYSTQNKKNKMYIYKGKCTECDCTVCKLVKELIPKV